MRCIYFICALLFLPVCLQAQNQFRQYQVAQTGVSLYLPADPGSFTLSLGSDSSEVYNASVFTSDSLEWGTIVVQLKHQVDAGNQNALLKIYLDYLKEVFDITAWAGYGEGHTLESNPGTTGVIDYWEDGSGRLWELKGWINTRFICVTYVVGKKGVEKNFSATRFFFNSVRFP